ncbi:tyrosine-type recombinase/integrase [Streptomyces sp. NPDC005485]|uniref:tyrosine-type recombinase/integrase n=1 Tax=Streptomyces sp. NPDC005485 TaxID=3155591 RepID=UPI0033A7A472
MPPRTGRRSTRWARPSADPEAPVHGAADKRPQPTTKDRTTPQPGQHSGWSGRGSPDQDPGAGGTGAVGVLECGFGCNPGFLLSSWRGSLLRFGRQKPSSDVSPRKSATTAGASNRHPSRVFPATPHRPQPRCFSASWAAPHREQQERERLVAGEKWQPTSGQPDGLIFTTATGGVTDPRGLNRMLTILFRDAHVHRVRVHDLRHTCASVLLAQGVDARTIMEALGALGHSTITMTLDTYAHVMDTTLRAAAERMDDALNLDEPDRESEGEAEPDSED